MLPYLRMHKQTYRVAFAYLLLALIPDSNTPAAGLRDEAMTYRKQGYEAQQLGQKAEALAAYQKAVALDPSYHTPYNDIGVLLEEQGWLEEAERAYRQAIAVHPGYAEAYANLAMLYERVGEPEKAVYHWLQRYRLGDPDDAGTQRARAQLEAYGVIRQLEGVAVPAQAAAAGAVRELRRLSTLRINKGAPVTDVPAVSLEIPTFEASEFGLSDMTDMQMQLSNDGMTYTEPEPYAATKYWVLSEGDGPKTVFVMLQDKAGGQLAVIDGAIHLDTSAWAIHVTPTTNETAEQRLIQEAFQEQAHTLDEFRSTTEIHGDW